MSAADADNDPIASRTGINSATAWRADANMEDLRDVECMVTTLFSIKPDACPAPQYNIRFYCDSGVQQRFDRAK
ncbi:MAG: hypothetical protein WCJ18_06140 [Planctomycetota bacterium]